MRRAFWLGYTVLVIALVIFIALSFCGCKKVIDTTQEDVVAEVVDVHHRSAFVQMMWTGKAMIPINHPAKYSVTVRYEDMVRTFEDRAVYNKVMDHNLKELDCILVTEVYDNNTQARYLAIKTGG